MGAWFAALCRWFRGVRVALANFLPWAWFAALCRWFRGVRVALANFLPWGLGFLHCVGGLGVLGWP
jgi:uncharacterized protein YodC (DUF2158 family)